MNDTQKLQTWFDRFQDERVELVVDEDGTKELHVEGLGWFRVTDYKGNVVAVEDADIDAPIISPDSRLNSEVAYL